MKILQGNNRLSITMISPSYLKETQQKSSQDNSDFGYESKLNEVPSHRINIKPKEKNQIKSQIKNYW